MTRATVQLRHLARLEYGDSLPSERRTDGDVPVYGSNGQVGTNDRTNSVGPTIIVGRKGSYGRLQFSETGVFAIDTTFFIDRRMTKQHLRWLYYALQTARLEELSQDVGVPGLSREDAYSRRIPSPSPQAQQAIADFLDVETARIDTLIAKKRRMIELLDERGTMAVGAALQRFGVTLPASVEPASLRSLHLPDGWQIVALGRTLHQLTNGYVGPTRDILREEGVRYIQGLHLKRGRIDFDRRPYYVERTWHDARRRTSLRPGDVLIVQTGDIGQCAVVPDDFGDANCHALLIARVNPRVVTPAYLGSYLQSRFGRSSLLRVATGALHPHLEFGIRDVPILVPPLSVQTTIVADVTEQRTHLEGTVGRLDSQLRLIQEHRQALITAAVTGQMEVPGVAA